MARSKTPRSQPSAPTVQASSPAPDKAGADAKKRNSFTTHPMGIPTCLLCEAVRNRDPIAVQRIYDEITPGMKARLRKAVAGKIGANEIQDYIQEAWIAFLVALAAGFDCQKVPDTQFGGYIFGIAYNLWRNATRKDKPMIYFPDYAGALSSHKEFVLDILEGLERKQMIDVAMRMLSTDEREIIDVRFFQELEYEEIAIKLGISKDNARQRLSRAKNRLVNFFNPTRLTEKKL